MANDHRAPKKPELRLCCPIDVFPPHRDRQTAARLRGYVQALSNRRPRLVNINVIYQDQPAIYLLQIEATLSHLTEMRRVVGNARAYLNRLEPRETGRIRPWACITKLSSVDYMLTEILLNLAMFRSVCEAISSDRVSLHLALRAAFPALIAAYGDLLAQLSALAEKACPQPATGASEEAGR